MRRLTILLALAALPNVAHAAYCLNDPQGDRSFMHWPNHTVTFKINSASLAGVGGAAARQAIVDAFHAWAQAPCANLQIVDGGDTTSTQWMLRGDADTGAIVVFFANDDPTWMQQGSNIGYIASTFYNWTTASGHVDFVNASIMFNGAHFQYSATPNSMQLDIQEVAMREIGRMLGVSANPTNTASVMYGSVPYGDTARRTLTVDDQDALAYLYPQASPSGACAQIPAPLASMMCPDTTGGATGGSGGGGAGGNPGGSGGAGGSAGSGAGGAGGGMGSASDSGCQVSIGAEAGAGVTALLLLATLALCAFRRRSR